MTTTFGVTATGFVAPTVQELIALMQADQLAGVSASLDVSPDSVIGQLNGIHAFYLAQAWEALAACYDGFDPDKAEGVMLTMLSKLTGTPRTEATPSAVSCIVATDIGTVLLAGIHFASVVGKPDVKFTPKVNYTAIATSATILWVSEKTGPVQAPAGQLSVIATPVVGWTFIVNPGDATPGSFVESDPQLRLTRQQELTGAGSSTVDAVFAKLVLLFGGIAGASVAPFNNVGDSLDVNGLPAHSFEMVIWDPTMGTISNDTIAQTIWNSKPSGIPSYGTSTGNAIDKTGATQAVKFSKATPVPIYVSYTVAPKVSYVGAHAFAIAVALACSEGIIATDNTGALTTILEPFKTGTDVTLYDVTLATQGLGAQVSTCFFGTTPSPVANADIVIGTRQIATFDSSRIVVAP